MSCHTHTPPEGYAGPELDEIMIFDGKGERTIFYAKTYRTMDLELGLDGWVYLAERDRILRINSLEGEDDGEPCYTIPGRLFAFGYIRGLLHRAKSN